MVDKQPATKKAAAKSPAARKAPATTAAAETGPATTAPADPGDPAAADPAPADPEPRVAADPVAPSRESIEDPSALVTEHGTTSIADQVVSKIAGIAAHDVPGVYALGGSTARAVGALRDRIPGSTTHHAQTQGISVEVGETEAAVDLQMVAEYGVPIAEVAARLRSAVIGAIEEMTALKVTEVNIEVNDVHLVDEDSEEG